MRNTTAARRRRPEPKAYAHRARPYVEALEDRTLLDGGLGTLHPGYLGLLPTGSGATPSSGPHHTPPRGAAPRVPPNVLVNDPAEDGTGPFDTQSETAVLAFGNTVIAAFNDSLYGRSNPQKYTGFARSTDGGTSFVDGEHLPTESTAGDSGDPVLARDNVSGRIYLSLLTARDTIGVLRSDTDGASWMAPVNASPGRGRVDKEWITVDNFSGTGQGNVYMVMRDFAGGNGIYWFRSTDAGDTWGPNGGTLIASAGGGNVQGAWVTVGPDHAVYAFWYESSSGTPSIKMRKSTDLGVTFGPAVTVTTLAGTGVNGDLGLGGFRSNSFPQALVHPTNPSLVYVVYDGRGTASGDRGDVFFRISSNGGMNWGPAIKVNDDTTTRDQWQPALGITPNGAKVGVFWYDRRNDAANNLIDRYGAIGNVSGNEVIFQPNIRITDVSFAPEFGHDPAINSTYMGDYDQVAATNSAFYTTWGDNRSPSRGHSGNNADVRIAKVVIEVAGPSVIASQPNGDTVAPVNRLRVTFDEEIDVATFTPDKIPSFRGPGGPIRVTAVTPVTGSGNTQFDITFPGQTALGNYNMVVGPDIRDLDGHPMDQNGNGVTGEIPGDQYTARFTIHGPRILASTPNDNRLAPIDHVRVTFNEPMNAATFTPAKIFAFRGPNGFIDVTQVAPVGGTNDTQFDISFAPQGTTGPYTMLIGPDIRDLAGHQMDQNDNFLEGEIPADMYAARFGILGPKIVASSPSGTLTLSQLPITQVQVTFNEAMNPDTFTPDNAVFTGPGGVVPVTGVTPVAGSNNTRFTVTFDPLVATGRYRMVIGPNVRDLFDNPMDQNGNLIPGEIPDDQYVHTFNIPGPRITAATPNTTSGPVFDLRVTFSEPMAVSTFTPDRIAGFTGPNGDITVNAVVFVPGTNFTQFDILFDPQTAVGRYAMVIGPDIRDVFGNPMDQNQNFIPGEIPDDRYVARFIVPGPKVAASSPAGGALPPVDHVRVAFSTPMDPGTFSPDKVASFLGPQGAITVTDVVPVPFTNNTQFDITFDPQTAPGNYTLVIGPDIRDVFGNPMDQNQNGIPGEIPEDQYTARFTILGPIGPDAFGHLGTVYPFEDNDILGQPGTFTIINFADDESVPVNLGTNTFTFYGVTYTGNNQLFVSSNGLITFGSANSSFINSDLTFSPPQAAISALWTDWIKTEGSPMLLGRFDGNRLILEWNQVRHLGSSGRVTFQVILYLNTGENEGDVVFNYNNLESGDIWAEGNDQTVGIKASGTQGPDRLLANFRGRTPYVGTRQALLWHKDSGDGSDGRAPGFSGERLFAPAPLGAAVLSESAALLFAAKGKLPLAPLGPPVALLSNGGSTRGTAPTRAAPTAKDINTIDGFFASRNRSEDEQTFELSHSEEAVLSLARRRREDAVVDLFGQESPLV